MIIQIAMGIVLAVIILLTLATVVYFVFLAITKHRELMESTDYDISEWFKKGEK